MRTEVAPPPRSTPLEGHAGGPAWLAAGLPVALLLVATWYYGAFALRHWAPVGVLAIAVLAAVTVGGGARIPERWARVAVGALWALALWALLSALWAHSPAGALEGAARNALYAALLTVPCALHASGRDAVRMGALLTVGLAAIAAIALAWLVADGAALFLAGRLDEPVGYRNATGCLFALGFWPLLAAGARRDLDAPLRAGALAGAALTLGLALMTQARGVALGLAAGALVALGLGPDRLRRAWAALAIAAAVAVMWSPLLAPYRAFSDTGTEASAADVATAVDALMLLTALVLVGGLAAALLDGGLRLTERARRGLRAVLGTALGIVTALVLVAGLVELGDPVEFVNARVGEFRSLETTAAGGTRLTFGGGQRADLWRIALVELADNPVAGVGEGSYRFGYYEERRTDRNLTVPHSLVFRVAAELGLVGLLCLLAFAAGIAGSVVSRWHAAAPAARRSASALLALGTVGLVQGAVDWLWLIPAVTGVSVVAIGLGIAALRPERRGFAAPSPDRREAAGRARRSPGHIGRSPGRLLAGGGLVLAAAFVAAIYLGDAQVRHARAIAADRPDDRLAAAERAETLNPWSPVPLYLQASALEDLGRRSAARARLRRAVELEPRNFVVYALLGDLETRAGNPRRAQHMYTRARELNPLDAGLRELAGRG